MTKSMKRSFAALLMLLLVFVLAVAPQQVQAAESNYMDYLTMPDDSGDTYFAFVGDPSSGDKFDYTLGVYHNEAMDHTFTFINKTDKKIKVTFTYLITKGGEGDGTLSFTNAKDVNGLVTATLEGGESFSATLAITTRTGDVNFYVDMYSITVEEVKAAIVKLNYDTTLGTVNYANNADIEVPDTGLALTATTKNGSKFLGWVDQDNKILSTDASYTLNATKGLTGVKACFATTSPWFQVPDTGASYLIEGLNQAAAKAAKTSAKSMVLMNDATLASGKYEIPAGVNMIIPYNDAHTPCIGKPNIVTDARTNPTAYRTLTMASGAELTVKGGLSVAGSQTGNMGASKNSLSLTTSTGNGAPTGPLGMIQMAGNSSIVVASGGNLYAWGFIYRTGAGNEGAITVQKGGTVYEDFQVADFRGGTYTSIMVTGSTGILGSVAASVLDVPKDVFPFTQYYVQNIQVPLTLQAGASEKLVFSAHVGDNDEPVSPVVEYIGTTTGMFRIADDGKGGYITKDYVEDQDRLHFTAKGTITMGNIILDLTAAGTTLSIDSSNFVLPLNGNITVDIQAGSNVTVSQQFCILPEAEMYIREGATVTLAKNVFLYDGSDWGDKYCGANNVRLAQVNFAWPKVEVTRDLKDDAQLVIGGTLNATSGKLYITNSHPGVKGEGENGKLVITKGSETETRQAAIEEKTYLGFYKATGPNKKKITVKTPLLIHADGKTLNTSSDNSTTHYYAHGMWHTGTTEPKVVTDKYQAPTCTAPGKTEGSRCADSAKCGKVYVAQTEIAQLEHNYVAGEVTPPTCVADGYTTYNCSYNCGTSVQRDTVTKLDHNFTAGTVVAPTCTTEGYTVYTCDKGCNGEENRDTVAVLGHSVPEQTGTWSEDYKSYTVTGVCTNGCGQTLTANAVVTDQTKPATCTETGLTTYTATLTEEWVTAETATKEVTLDALGHKYGTVAYNWNDDYTVCTAESHCEHNAIHVAKATTDVVSDEMTIAPGCESEGVMTYTATFDGEDASWMTEKVCTKEVAIPATGHTYVPGAAVWTGTESCTITGTCSCGDTVTATAEITREQTKKPLCGLEGETTYTATFKEEWVINKTATTTAPIDALTHVWGETDYAWSTDKTQCTATRTCTYGCVETAEASVKQVVTNPTCTEAGYTTCTATFTADWAAEQTETIAGEAAKDHAWSVTYTWNEDMTTCTATHVCANDAAHNETETVTVTKNETDATCTTYGKAVYTATFEAEWAVEQTKTVMGTEYAPHTYVPGEAVWNGTESCTITGICSCSDTKTAEAVITSEQTQAPACGVKGETTYTATFEAEWATSQTKTVADIDALTHVWTLGKYEWSEDGKTCTAYAKCSYDASHTTNVTATVEGNQSKAPACGVNGETTYTATFEAEWATSQTKTVADIDALTHDWTLDNYEWSEDGKTCTAYAKCDYDASHTTNVAATVEGNQSKAPACGVKGETTYTATFEAEWATSQTKTVADIDALTHVWTLGKYEWSEDGKTCTAYAKCSRDASHTTNVTATVEGNQSKAPACGVKGETTYTATFEAEWATSQTKTVADIDALDHVWGEAVYTWSDDMTECTATHVCANDAAHNETETVTVTKNETDATCTTYGKTVYTATFEAAWAAEQTKTVDGDTYAEHSWTDGVCGVCGNVCTHEYVDGICGTCGAVKPIVIPTGSIANQDIDMTLSLESEIFVNVYFKVTGFEGYTIDPEDIGLLAWDTKLASPAACVYDNADRVSAGGSYDPETGEFKVRSKGIAAKNMADDCWYKIYIRLPDGSYIYSARFRYTPEMYCEDVVIDGLSSNQKLKALCVAMMNYGADAQVYFANRGQYSYTTLMNEKYANYQYLVTDFADKMLEAVKAMDSFKHGEFKNTSGYFKRFDETVTLTGALSLNVELTCINTEYTEVGMLIWSEEDYQNATTLTWDNATAIATTTTVASTSAKLSYTGIAAKDIGKTVYACGYMVVDGNYYYSGVFTTSIEKYASTAINGSGIAADLKSLMKALAVYSEYAKNYFA